LGYFRAFDYLSIYFLKKSQTKPKTELFFKNHTKLKTVTEPKTKNLGSAGLVRTKSAGLVLHLFMKYNYLSWVIDNVVPRMKLSFDSIQTG